MYFVFSKQVVETIRGVEVDIVNRLEDYDRSLKENQVLPFVVGSCLIVFNTRRSQGIGLRKYPKLLQR